MSCNCGKPKCKGQCGCKSPAVLQINNPSEYVTFHKVTIPAAMGDSTTNPPRNGAYRNALVWYEADNTSWMYSTDGIPTKLTNGVTNYEDAANLPQINGHTLIGNQTSSDLGLQGELTAGDNIQIEGNTISATDTTYTAGDGIEIDGTEIKAKIGDGLEFDNDGEIDIANIEQYAHFFDTVADMKAAGNLVDGSFARTLGYYAVNDGGGGLYKIDNSADVADNGSVIDLNSGLKAKLQKDSAGFINVKQFGAKGDDSTDDTQAFINALRFCPKMNIPTATYRVIMVNFLANAIINGNNSIINSERPDGDLRLNAFGNNSTINDLTINSLNEDKAWNRIDISGKHDITFNNCKFSGFRDQSDWKNAWAFFIKDTQRVVFNKCYFENNNFQDILIEINSRDIVFNDCDGDHFFVDIEPGQNSTDLVECVTFNRCNMFKVHLYENFLTTTQIRNVTFNDCKIDTVTYDGTTASFNNCIIEDWENEKVGDNNLLYAGMAEFNQSLNLGENLIQDNYFDNVTLSSSRSWWYVSYSNGINFRTGLTSVREDDTNYIVLNPNNTAGTIWVSTPHIEASAGDKYLLRFSGKANYPANGTWISEIATIRFYDSSDTLLESNAMSAFRSSADSTTPRITQNAIILCPENTAYFVIHFRNGRGGSVNKLYLEKCQLFKLNARNEYSNEIPELPKRKYRKFYADVIPTDSGNYMPYHKGDELVFNDPATSGYVGAICTAEPAEGHYVGTWKKYGALEP